jgi:hypothetical protein
MLSMTCLIMLLAFISPSSNAQVGFGPEFGYNWAGMLMNTTGSSDNTFIKEGLMGGLVMYAGIGRHLMFQSGALYLRNGCTFLDKGGKIIVNTVQIPFNLSIKYGLRGVYSRTMAYVGICPYIAYNFSGTVVDENGKSNPLKIGSEQKNASGGGDDLLPIDKGFGLNFGVFRRSGSFLRLRYQVSLTNLSPNAGQTINAFSYCLSSGFVIMSHRRDHGWWEEYDRPHHREKRYKPRNG